MPLNITVFVLKRPATDLEGSEAHTRPDLAELTGIVRCLDKDMMPDLYDIIHILESNNSATLWLAFGRWQRWKEVLEHFHNSLANWRGEALKQLMSAIAFVQRHKTALQDVTVKISCPRLGSNHGLSK